MKKMILSKDSVSLCYKNTCLNVNGSKANLVATGIFALIIVTSISALLTKSN